MDLLTSGLQCGTRFGMIAFGGEALFAKQIGD
jgi:hypothetical protein